MKSPRTVVGGAVLAACLSVATTTTLAEDAAAVPRDTVTFQVKGTVRTTAYEGTRTSVFNSRFHVQVDDCRFLVTSLIDGDADTESYALYSEGTNATIVLRHRDVAVTRVMVQVGDTWVERPLEKPQPSANQGTVLVCPDGIPLYGFEFMTVAWLAYGGRCRYDSTGTGDLTPVVDIGPGFREYHRRAKTEWRKAKTPPAMLEYLAEFSDGYAYERRGRELVSQQRPPPWDGGFTNAIFQVDVWTNLAGLTLPAGFHLTKFAPVTEVGDGSSNLRVVYTCVGVADGFDTRDSDVREPEVPRRSRVIDYTAGAGGKYYSYGTTNGQLLTPEEIQKHRTRRVPRPTTSP